MKKSCAILQPHYLPYLGYFDLINRVDNFIFLDDVKYIKREWKNRNQIRKTFKGTSAKWLSVPIEKKYQNHNLNQVLIEDNKWRKEHINQIENVYDKTENFNEFFPEIKKIICDDKNNNLSDLNIKLIMKGCEFLKIKSNFFKSSEFSISFKKDLKLLEICKILNCNYLLANNRTLEYADSKMFNDNNIIIESQNYNHIIYDQKYNSIKLMWIPFLSWIDYIFNRKIND